MGGEARGERHSDRRGRRSVRRLSCVDRSVERHVNTSLPLVGRMSGACELLRCPQVVLRPVSLPPSLLIENVRASSGPW